MVAAAHSYVPSNLPGGNNEAAEDVDERDEGGGRGEPLHRIGGMVAAAHSYVPTNLPGGNNEAAEDIDERDEGGDSGAPPPYWWDGSRCSQLCSY